MVLSTGAAVGAAHLLSACESTMQVAGDAMVAPDTTQQGGCAPGLAVCNGVCADLQRDRGNCGECGLACNTKGAEVCVMGQCVFGCSGGATKCGDFCVDTKTNSAHCGGCGMKCDEGFVCADGKCAITCLNGYTACDSDAGKRCTNVQTDDQNCGACGTKCDPGALCDQGSCTVMCQPNLTLCQSDAGPRCADLTLDPQNCGACGKVCDGGTFCSPPAPLVDGGDAGIATCGLQCFGGTTKCGNRCVDTKIDPSHCGGCNNGCDGGTCSNGMCQ